MTGKNDSSLKLIVDQINNTPSKKHTLNKQLPNHSTAENDLFKSDKCVQIEIKKLGFPLPVCLEGE